MDTMSSRRKATGGSVLLVLACAFALVLGGHAQAATVDHPAGGSSFSGSAQGWESSDASCGLLSGISLLCTTTAAYDGSAGNPAGSIDMQVDVTANVLGLFTATGTWQSPAFTPTPSAKVTGVTFAYDRRVDSGGLLDLQPSSEVVVTLLDQTAGSSTPVLTETLTNDNEAFVGRSVSVPAGSVTAGHSYRLRIATTTTSSVVGLLGQANTRFDNVRLTVVDTPSTGGPNNSTGVTVIRRTVSNTEISRLISRYGIDSEVGRGEGGSLIPRALCTIVGTPGPDRIAGTSANDVICGRGGNDVIQGGGGRDVVDSGNGSDRLGGGGAGDLLLGLRGNDRLDGGSGGDAIGGGAGRDIVAGGSGNDRISGRSGNDRIAAAAGADRLAGGSGSDRLNGGRGRDRISGGPGRDRIVARDRARDSVFGGSGRDVAAVDSARGSSRGRSHVDRMTGIELLR